MKAFQFFRIVIVLGGILLSACAAAPSSQAVSPAASAGSDKPVSEVLSTPDASSTQAPVTPGNNARETIGTIESMSATTITINGQTYTLVPGTEIKGTVTVGTIVKLHFITSADGTLTVTEVGAANSAQVSGGNSSNDNSNGTDVNDDHSSSSSDDQLGDDHGGDSHSNDGSGRDDHGSGGGSSDDGSGHQ